MKILTGIDAIEIKEFRESLDSGKKLFLDKIFTPEERRNSNPEHLAGLFAAKEAVLKALSLKPGDWLKIEIRHEKSGKPYAIVDENFFLKSSDLSISHTVTIAIAVFVAIT